MTQNSKQDTTEADWSFVESHRQASGPQPSGTIDLAYNTPRGNELSPALSNAPADLDVPEPDMEAKRGILMQWKKNQIDRKTALAAIQAQHDAQLDALRYHLTKAVTVSNARADRIAEEFLKKLDSEHIQVLKELGLRNADTRATALIEVRDMIAAKLLEVQSKKWPNELVGRTIDDLFDLEKRVCAELMRELGSS